MRIPTLLALAFIVIAIALGVGLFLLEQNRNNQNKQFYIPQDIRIVNITGSTVTITWQTNKAITGSIMFGDNPTSLNQEKKDERDKTKPENHLVHFVTVTGLNPNTTYFYQIKSGTFLFPPAPQEVKTGPKIDSSVSSSNTPIRGTVLDSELNPIDEALVFLTMENGSPLGTVTTTAGNFILPLSELRSTDLTHFNDLQNKSPAILTIVKGTIKTEAQVSIPLEQALPPLTLGEQIDLRVVAPSPSASIAPVVVSQFDLNKDNKINAVDLSIVLNNLSNNPKDKSADFNKDGVIDTKDIELIQKALQ